MRENSAANGRGAKSARNALGVYLDGLVQPQSKSWNDVVLQQEERLARRWI